MERTGRKKYFYKVIPIQNLNITKNLFVLCMSFSPSINKIYTEATQGDPCWFIYLLQWYVLVWMGSCICTIPMFMRQWRNVGGAMEKNYFLHSDCFV